MNKHEPNNESTPIAELQKNVLNDLAKHLMKLKEIQEKYDFDDPKPIYKIRDWAITNFYSIKSELPEVTQQYLKLWAAQHHRKLIDSEQIDTISDTKSHRDDLANRAREMVNHLKTYSGYADDWNIYDTWSNENDIEGLKLLDDPLVQDLFLHLKQDLPELSKFSSWDDLTFGEITFQLKKKILKKAAKRDFNGKCDIL